MRTRNKIFLSIGIVFLFFFIIILGVYISLRTPGITSKFIPKVQKILKEQGGIESEIGEASIDLLGNISIKNIKAYRKNLDVSVPKIKLEYSLWSMLFGEVVVKSFSLSNPRIEIKITQDSKIKEPVAEDPDSKPLPELIDLWLNKPPIFVNLDHIDISHAKLDIQIDSPKGSTIAFIQDLNFKSSIHHNKGVVSANSRISLPKSPLNQIQILNSDDKNELKLKVNPALLLEFSLLFKENQPKSWESEIEVIEFLTDFSKLELLLKNSKSQTDLKLGSHHLKFSLDSNIILKDENSLLKVVPDQINFKLNLAEENLDINLKDLKSGVERKITLSGLNLNLDKKLIAPKNFKIEKVLENLNSEITKSLSISDLNFLEVTPSGISQNIKLKKSDFSIQSDIKEGKGSTKLILNTDSISGLPIPEDPSINIDLELQTDFPEKVFIVDLKATDHLNNQIILQENLSIKPDKTSLEHVLDISYSNEIDRYLNTPMIQKMAGIYQVSLKGVSELVGPIDIYSPDFQKIIEMPLSNVLKLELNQLVPPEKPSIKHSKPIKLELTNRVVGDVVNMGIKIAAKSLEVVPLKKPISLNIASDLVAPISLEKAYLTTEVSLNQKEIFSLITNVLNKPKKLTAKATLTADTKESMFSLLPDLEKLKLAGLMSIKTDLNLEVNHKKSTILDFKPENLDQSKISGELILVGTQIKSYRESLVKLPKPLNLKIKLKGNNKKGTVSSKVDLPSVQSSEFGNFQGLKLNANGKYNIASKVEQSSFSGNINLNLSDADPSKKIVDISGIKPFLKNISLQVSALIHRSDKFDLSKFKFKSGNNNILMDITGGGSIKKKTFQTSGNIAVDFPNSNIKDIGLNGSFSLPFTGFISDGSRVSFSTTPKFNNFTLKTADFNLQKLNGELEVEEQLILSSDYKKAKFSYIISEDPFKRVDYNRIQPYLKGEQNFQAEKIKFRTIEIGPLNTNIKIKQNIVTIPYVATKLLGGHYVGKIHLDFKPSQLSLGYLGRITRIDLDRILNKGSNKDSERFSSRVGISMDINRSLLEGKIDVTEIGKTQLLQMLDILDPKQEDPKINQARSGLRIAHPTYIGLSFQRGLMDMVIKLDSGISSEIAIEGIPLTSFLEAEISPFKETINQLPLE